MVYAVVGPSALSQFLMDVGSSFKVVVRKKKKRKKE